MKRWRTWGCVVLAAVVSACGAPNTQGLQGERAVTIAQTPFPDRVTLDDGTKVALIGIEAPRRGQPEFEGARAALERLALHRPAKIAHEGKATLNDETALAHLFVQTEGGRWVWAQEALLLEGLARVHTRKDGAGRAEALLEAETAAREAGRGIWAERSFAVKDSSRNLERLTEIADACRASRRCRGAAEDAPAADGAALTPTKASATPKVAAEVVKPGDDAACAPARTLCRTEGFQLVEGRVRSVFVAERGGVHLNFGPDYKTDFSVYVAPADAQAWSGGVDALRGLEGQRLRVRGYLDSFNGPSIRVDHAAQVEMLEQTKTVAARQTAPAKEHDGAAPTTHAANGAPPVR